MFHLAFPAARCSIALAVVLAALLGGPSLRARQGEAQAAPITLDVVAVDREGRFVDGLRPADFSVTVNGTPRAVAWLRRVSRGPGAATEAASRATNAGLSDVGFAAEPARTVLVVVDQASLLRGDERGIVQAASLFLDRLGLNDRVAVITLPAPPRVLLSFSSERAEVRAVLGRVAGGLAPAPAQARALPASHEAPEQAGLSGLNPEGRIQVDPTSEVLAPGAGAERSAATLPALRSLFETLGGIPGRKVVAVFSAGFGPAPGGQLDEAARAAASARAVVFGFGARSAGNANGFSTAPLERLAAASGGTFAALGRNPSQAIAAAVDGLGACYVLGLAAPPLEGGTAPRRLRVEATRRGLSLRVPAWLPSALDGDLVAQAAAVPTPAAGMPAPEAGNQVSDARGDEPRRKVRKAKDDELLVALARLFDYAEGYERQYSMLVAEEDYRQSASAGGVRLKSDLLLVRPVEGGDWISFRDVFEVDGKPVRDREDRLRRLFLDPSPDARARLQAIGEESARHNVGWVERTTNVPLLPLSFLRAANRARFEYELAGRDTVGGIEAQRVEYTERARPTLLGDRLHQDVPVFGSFLVDAASGALVETRMNARRGEARAEIVVRYRPDPGLGLWVPAEMNESYSQPDGGYSGRSGLVRRAVVEGRATYSNFRRFQVTTGEAVRER